MSRSWKIWTFSGVAKWTLSPAFKDEELLLLHGREAQTRVVRRRIRLSSWSTAYPFATSNAFCVSTNQHGPSSG